jgi:hypothetical protein
MLEEALRARIPLIKVHTTDPAHVPQVLAHLDPFDRKVGKLSSKAGPNGEKLVEPCMKWRLGTLNRSAMSKGPEGLFHWFTQNDSTLVFVNPLHDPGPMFFDAGELPTPSNLVFEMLGEAGLSKENILEIETALGGLTLKDISWVIRLAQSEMGSTSRRAVATVRRKWFPVREGLAPVDVAMPFYVPHPEIESWIDDARHFMLDDDERIRPRGLLFDGPPGTGKTLGAKRIAAELDLPLFRLETAGVKSKWVGESEKAVSRMLNLVDKEAPCVLLIDEIEKILSSQHDGGVTAHIMGTLLWWLQEHTSPVLTVMTTNKVGAIPPEVWRAGRIDKKIVVGGLDENAAAIFVDKLLDTFDLEGHSVSSKDIDKIVGHAGPSADYGWIPSSLNTVTTQFVKDIKKGLK